MALLGGGVGGAGNPVGGSFTGPAEALEIEGDFAYAYSGFFIASTTIQTVLKFTTGNYLFYGTLQLNGPVDDDNPALTSIGEANISMNGAGIAILTNVTADAGSPNTATQDLIIPAYTEIQVDVVSSGNEGDHYGSVIITGRIYRTRD